MRGGVWFVFGHALVFFIPEYGMIYVNTMSTL